MDKKLHLWKRVMVPSIYFDYMEETKLNLWKRMVLTPTWIPGLLPSLLNFVFLRMAIFEMGK